MKESIEKYQENFVANFMINGEWESVEIKKSVDKKNTDSMRVKFFHGRYRTKAEHITLFQKIVEILKTEF